MPFSPSRPNRSNGIDCFQVVSRFPAIFVVTLLALLPATGPLAAQAGGGPPVTSPPTTIEGIVTGIEDGGRVVVLLGSPDLRVDVSQARIVGSSRDTSAAGPAPSASAAVIDVGSRIEAEVTLPDTPPTGSPLPPLMATNVVVKETRFVEMRGVIQAVDVPGMTFELLFRTIHVDANTDFGGESDKGPIQGLGDLTPGMFADATVTVAMSDVSAPILLAVKVSAHGTGQPPATITFGGVVKSIGTDSWTIDDRVVGITTDTKIVGDPKVGDMVLVVATVQNPPNPGMGMPSRFVALSITKIPEPPPPVSRSFAFSGPVRSISSPDPHNGVWRIGGHEVVVNGLTVITGNPVVGDLVDVKGHVEIVTPSASPGVMMPFAFRYVAESIAKKK